MRTYFVRQLLIIGLLGQSLVPTSGYAQECAIFKAIPTHAALTVTGPVTQSAGSSLNFCRLIPDETYYLRVGAFGFEYRSLKFSLPGKDQTLSLSAHRWPLMARSLVVPGWGQYEAGQSGALSGWIFFLSASSVLYSAAAYWDYMDAKDEVKVRLFDLSRTKDQSSYESLLQQIAVSSLRADTQRDYFYTTLTLTGWIYGWNLVETFLLTTPPAVRSQHGSEVTVETPRKSRSRGFFRSIFFPGMGQIYLGSEVKGTIIQFGLITAGVWAIEATRRYWRAEDTLDLSLVGLARASTPAEIDAARREVLRNLDQRKDKERNRNAAYIAVGGVWVVNMIDVLFSPIAETVHRGVGFETSVRGSEVRADITVSF